MKIPIGKIAAWIGRALLSAAISEAADRLARPRSEQARNQGQDPTDDADQRLPEGHHDDGAHQADVQHP